MLGQQADSEKAYEFLKLANHNGMQHHDKNHGFLSNYNSSSVKSAG